MNKIKKKEKSCVIPEIKIKQSQRYFVSEYLIEIKRIVKICHGNYIVCLQAFIFFYKFDKDS